MKQTIIFISTLLVLGIGNWLISSLIDQRFIDVSIPYGAACAFLAHSFTGGTSTFTRQSDMQTRGETGIRMLFSNKAARFSLVFIASIAYLLFTLVTAFIIYM